MALNPGTGGSMAGDFALPTLDLGSSDLGVLEIFELGDVDSPPKARTKIEFSCLCNRVRALLLVKVEYVVNQNGRVDNITIVERKSQRLKMFFDAHVRTRSKGGTAVAKGWHCNHS